MILAIAGLCMKKNCPMALLYGTYSLQLISDMKAAKNHLEHYSSQLLLVIMVVIDDLNGDTKE